MCQVPLQFVCVAVLNLKLTTLSDLLPVAFLWGDAPEFHLTPRLTPSFKILKCGKCVFI